MTDARRPRVPDGYDPSAFPPFAVTVDVVVLTLRERRLHVLLIQRGGEPFRGCWALPGGFVRPAETLEEAAARELREETGVDAAAYLEQVAAYGDPDRDPRMRVVTVSYLAVLPGVGEIAAGSDAARAAFVPVEEVLGTEPGRALAFDHALILSDAVAYAQEKLTSTSLATAFVGPEFTLGDLREVYEAAWGVDLDPGNFRRKVLATEGFVTPTGRRASSGSGGGKPAETYRPVGRVRLHPSIEPPWEEVEHGPGGAQAHLFPRLGLERRLVWRVWLGEDSALHRAMLEAGVVAPIARGEAAISDEEWSAFLSGMQLGDYVIAATGRGRVAIGEIKSAVQERPKARDRRLRQIREVEWSGEIQRARLPKGIRERLDGPGVVAPLRVSAAAWQLQSLIEK